MYSRVSFEICQFLNMLCWINFDFINYGIGFQKRKIVLIS